MIAKKIGYITLLTLLVGACQKDPLPPLGSGNKVYVKISNVLEVGQKSANVLSEISGAVDGVLEKGVCYAESELPTIESNKISSSSSEISFACRINNLTPNKKYFVRAYARTNYDVIYGEGVDFVTHDYNLAGVSLSQSVSIGYSNATVIATILSDGGGSISSRGVCWSTSPSPTVDNFITSNGSGLGNFTANLSNLNAGTLYYVRAFAVNQAGTSYSNAIQFSTLNYSLPTLGTLTVSNIGTKEVFVNASVLGNGGGTVSARGFCWATHSNPTLSSSFVNSGSGTGTFSSNIPQLLPGTLYYVRAYATNQAGTAYGSVRLFTTSTVGLSAMGTLTITNVLTSSATATVNITSSGGGSIIERGVCYSTSTNPTILAARTSNGTGTNTFTTTIFGLLSNTTYYVRSYATNEAGTAYGTQQTFKTK